MQNRLVVDRSHKKILPIDKSGYKIGNVDWLGGKHV
jgi:hypothetical protein